MVRNSSIQLSLIIPVFNEELLLGNGHFERFYDSLYPLVERLETIFVDNGSSDRSVKLLEIVARRPGVTVITLPYRSYGDALYYGSVAASQPYCIWMNFDWLDLAFITTAIAKIDRSVVVTGCKTFDRRPYNRRILSKLLNASLNRLFHYNITDSHGPKLVARDLLRAFLSAHLPISDLIETELLLYAVANGYSVVSVDTDVCEIRPPRTSITGRIAKICYESMVLLETYPNTKQTVEQKTRMKKSPGAGIVIDDFGLLPAQDATILSILEGDPGEMIESISLFANVGMKNNKAIEELRSFHLERSFKINTHISLSAGNGLTTGQPFPSGFLRLALGSVIPSCRAKFAEEIERQIRAFIDAGFKPDELNSEHNVHILPTMFPLFLDAAKRHGFRTIRCPDYPVRDFPLIFTLMVCRNPGAALKLLIIKVSKFINERTMTANRFPLKAYLFLPSGLPSPALLFNQRFRSNSTFLYLHPGTDADHEIPGLQKYVLRFHRARQRKMETDLLRFLSTPLPDKSTLISRIVSQWGQNSGSAPKKLNESL